MTGHTPQRRIAFVLEYDGSSYAGSQLQENAPTIQEELENALVKLTGERLRVSFAGRTDAGVHAIGQVAACTTTSSLETDLFVRALNAHLPVEIAVRQALDVPEDFDPRRNASSRSYRYTIYNAPQRSPLWRTHAWHIAEPLDLAAMRQAAAVLVGEHDFASFSRDEGGSTVRCLQRSDVTQRGPLVRVELEANAFLRQQVRRTVGALAQVGTGRLAVPAFTGLLRRAEPALAGPLAPARGLCLLRVTYPSLDLSPSTRYDEPLPAPRNRRGET